MTVARLLLALLLLLLPAGAGAETARAILDRRKALDDGPRKWTDRYERLRLTIVDRRGGERVRDLEVWDLKLPGDEQKTILFFRTPAEVKGTGFLAFTHAGRPADQWLYLPELKRVRQITARSRKESFVGTDLSYHDLDIIQEMTAWTEADAASSLRGEESVDGIPVHVIELVPKRDDIGYARIVLWLGTDDLVPRRLDFFEGDGEATKRVTQGDVRTVGAIPVAHRLEVTTPAAGSHTSIAIDAVRFDQGLHDDGFSQRALELGRVD
jgi:outer membrane lipoprotein-sorting protein